MIAYTHPQFRDVVMVVIERFKTVGTAKMRVQWWRKDRKLYLGSQIIEIPLHKWREFKMLM